MDFVCDSTCSCISRKALFSCAPMFLSSFKLLSHAYKCFTVTLDLTNPSVFLDI